MTIDKWLNSARAIKRFFIYIRNTEDDSRAGGVRGGAIARAAAAVGAMCAAHAGGRNSTIELNVTFFK